MQFLGNVKADWGFLTIFTNDLKSETAILMRGRANENEKWLPRCGKVPTKNKNGCSDAGNGRRIIKMAIPMRDGDFENQNAVSRCGATVLKTEWDFPDAGRTV